MRECIPASAIRELVLRNHFSSEHTGMQLKTILNRVERYKSFVYQEASLAEDALGRPRIEVRIAPRANGRPICSGCRRVGPGYDRLPERRFEFVPLWAIPVFFLYALRRVNCPQCGVKVEEVPWGDGKCTLTTSYRWFLAGWAKRLSWKETAAAFQTTWDQVYRAVKHAVSWGVVHRELTAIRAIGVDEIQWRRGHKYLTLVYQIEDGVKRLLWVAADRTEQSLEIFFEILGKRKSDGLRFTCSDMWKPYLNVLRERARNALLVLDRFHVMAKLNKALDEVRAAEARRLQQDGYEPVLKHSRWCLLKRPENLTDQQTVKLAELLQYNLQSVRAYLLREDFQRFWEYRSPVRAQKFLDEWCRRAMRSKIEPLKKVARTLRKHSDLLLNWFRAEGAISSGSVEGLNNKAKLTMRKAYGFRTENAITIALFHGLGKLPEPKFTHKFY
jgi:transposase